MHSGIATVIPYSAIISTVAWSGIVVASREEPEQDRDRAERRHAEQAQRRELHPEDDHVELSQRREERGPTAGGCVDGRRHRSTR